MSVYIFIFLFLIIKNVPNTNIHKENIANDLSFAGNRTVEYNF